MLSDARILLTGATGRLGRCIAGELVRRGCDLVLIVRASSAAAATERAKAALEGDVDPRRLTVLQGDVTDPELGLRVRERARLRASVDVVLHAAATTSFTSPLEVARGVNVDATRNVLAFAQRAPRVRKVAYVSTAFVAGKRVGRVLESELEHDHGFLNTYQQSKYEAEQLVQRHRDLLPLVVLRPSIVLDGSGPAPLARRSAFRFALELLRRGLVTALPGSADTPVDLVTEGDAAGAIANLVSLPSSADAYHIAGGERSPTLAEVVEPFAAVRFLRDGQFAWELTKWRHEKPRLAGVYDELASFIYEVGYAKVFDTSRAHAALGRPVQMEDPLAALLGDSPAVAVGAIG